LSQSKATALLKRKGNLRKAEINGRHGILAKSNNRFLIACSPGCKLQKNGTMALDEAVRSRRQE
jgi:hypothetical protein